MDAKIDKGKLVLSVPLGEAHMSNGGKMMLLASTGGFTSLPIVHEGKPLKLSLIVGYNLPKNGAK
jgi:hypothetical protein